MFHADQDGQEISMWFYLWHLYVAGKNYLRDKKYNTPPT